MDYISTKEAAKKWLVSIRCVQGFLAEGRIPGATKLGRSWAIPSDAMKPADLRNREDTERSAGEYPHVPHLYCYLPLPRGNADLAGQSLKNETERTMLRAELAKFRGDFATAERLCRQIPAGSPIKVCASALLAECAVKDRIWGIGLSMHDPARLDPAQWRGQNLLGYALMLTRRKLDRIHER